MMPYDECMSAGDCECVYETIFICMSCENAPNEASKIFPFHARSLTHPAVHAIQTMKFRSHFTAFEFGRVKRNIGNYKKKQLRVK